MKTKRLESQVRPVTEFSELEVRQLFDIFSRHYEQVDWSQFERDLLDKDFVILLRDVLTGEPRGFSTQKIFHLEVGGVSLRAIFSGDTIIDQAFWGEQELVRGWCRFAGQVLSMEPKTPLYWFLISKGYRTYLFLPIFYREFFPRFDRGTPTFEKEVIDTLAFMKFPEHYDAGSGVIDFGESKGQLTKELAEIPAHRRHHPHVRFFLEQNPSYARGTELVCLARISPENMRSIAFEALMEGMKRSAFRGCLNHA